MTFSAYDVVFRPAVAPRSLRGQGTVTIAALGAVGGVRRVQPEAGRAALEPVQVRAERERTTVHDLQRLEDPVTDRQPVVGDPDGPRVRVGEQGTVHPGVHGRHCRARRTGPQTLLRVLLRGLRSHPRNAEDTWIWRGLGHGLLFLSFAGKPRRNKRT